MTAVLYILAYLVAGVLVASLTVKLGFASNDPCIIFLMAFLWPCALCLEMIGGIVCAMCKAVEAITGEPIEFVEWW